MPNYMRLPMESHHILTRIEYGESSSYLMLLQQTSRGMRAIGPSWWIAVNFFSFLLEGERGKTKTMTRRAAQNRSLILRFLNFTFSHPEQKEKVNFEAFFVLLSLYYLPCNVQIDQRWLTVQLNQRKEDTESRSRRNCFVTSPGWPAPTRVRSAGSST